VNGVSANVDLLIIGAGPFGLSLASQVAHDEIDHLVLGTPMGFWEAHMPAGMYLRSECDWHLDPLDIDTIEAYLASQRLTPADALPLSLPFYLDYARWFQARKRISPLAVRVQRLDKVDGRFVARLDDGEQISATKVVLALGFEYFRHIPDDLLALLPPGRFSHTCDTVDLTPFREKQVLIIGGRQSAFEWAALLREQGAHAIHLSHRHASPAYQIADWAWVNPLVAAMVDDPGWFRGLPAAERDAVIQRMWGEGRLKVEPWLEPRLAGAAITISPQTRLAACAELPSGELGIRLDDGRSFTVDHIILATGYKVDLKRIPLLAQGNLLPEITTRNSFPALDTHFQTSVPGLYITSMAASQDFGPFFGFTGAVRTSAKLIAAGLKA
jgi:cation diffusion facilitator CzcD-associated flavoprotein CzcO